MLAFYKVECLHLHFVHELLDSLDRHSVLTVRALCFGTEGCRFKLH